MKYLENCVKLCGKDREMEIWRRIIIALGILIEIMSAAEVIYLIVITPYYDLIAVLFFIVPLLGFIVGGLIIYFSRYLVK